MKKIFLLTCCLFIGNIAIASENNNKFVLKTTIYKNKIVSDVVVYNLSNAKLHTSDCEWAEKCTKNCIYKDKKQISEMFYIPCAVCGGGIIEPLENIHEF